VRIVSLCPSLTELVFDLGSVCDLVGLTRYCIYPADKVCKVEVVGGTKDPDVARIIELAPDLVLMNDEENRIEDAEGITAAGLRVLSSMPRTAAETATMVRDIARALGCSEEGERIARDIEQRTLQVTAP
jgi:ABC-type hemin transport system substrate-binding protein